MYLDEAFRRLGPREQGLLRMAVSRGPLRDLDPDHGAGQLLRRHLRDVIAVERRVKELDVRVVLPLERALQEAQAVLGVQWPLLYLRDPVAVAGAGGELDEVRRAAHEAGSGEPVLGASSGGVGS